MISNAGYELIKSSEGLRLVAYPDPASGGAPWTIGYGHTKGVKKGDVITEEQANQFLYEDALDAWTAVLKHTTVELQQWELDALTDFVFNLGETNFANSTLLKKLNAGDRVGAANEFDKWVYASGKIMAGLVTRRTKEKKLFLNEGNKVAPFIIPALTSLISVAPDLIRVFGDTPQAEKNAKAAELVVNAAKAATGATNEQDLIQKINTKDPVVVQQVQQAVKDVWYEISIDNTGVEKAREYFANPVTPFWKQPAIYVTGALMPLVYFVTYQVLTLAYSAEIQAMVIGSIVSGVLGAITGFWLGTSFSSSRKTELLTTK